MTWWMWLLLWAVLGAGAVSLHVVLVRRVWRQVKAVSREISDLVRRIDATGPTGPVDTH